MPLRKRTFTTDLLTQQQGEVIKVGYLKKKGHVRRNWLDRWFVLTTEGMYYYKNRIDEKPIGVIRLFGSTAKEDAFQKHQHVFTCWTAEGKDFPIQASTRDEMLVWLSCIEDAANERGKRPPESTGPITKNPSSNSYKQESKKNSASAAAAARNYDSDDSETDSD